MISRVPFIKPGVENFPVIEDIYEYVPLPLVTLTDPAVGCKNNPNSCRLVRDVTKTPPNFPTNPLCFTLPDQAETAEIFIAAMRGTVAWNLISCKETTAIQVSKQPTVGRTSHHDKIWRFFCPCAGAPRKHSTPLNSLSETTPPPRRVNTVVHKDGSIAITSKNVKATHTVTTTIHGSTKKTTVATEITGEPCTPPTVGTLQREPSTKCGCSSRFFIRRRIDNGQHEVEWHWKHENHNPFSLTDMKNMRASGPIKQWLTEKVLAGMTWPTLQKLLRNSDLTRVRLNDISAFHTFTNIYDLGTRHQPRTSARSNESRLSDVQKLDAKGH